jgi:aryl-alcohol dehydrogenase-like predicted oxidoreductase
MALEFGLGMTPWSPLKSGPLSGKYTRQSAGKIKADRGFFTRAGAVYSSQPVDCDLSRRARLR